MNIEDARLLIDAADRLSAMADKVAGFAISSDLLLTFACLKDIASWVKNHAWAFVVGIIVGGVVYVGVVWCLYLQEFDIRALTSNAVADVYAPLNRVSWLLTWARSIGIAGGAVVAILAVLGTRKGTEG